MSKKAQKPQNPQNPKKQQIVDQQNEPFLRAISKRVRNINKKLVEIDELKKKGDLKPEQIEKVNRRVEYEQQRSRLEGIADFFRETYAENVEQYRNNQLQELDQLANAIAVLRGNVNWKEADKLAELNKALTQESTVSLVESAKNIAQVLRRFAGDFKLKKSVETLVAENQVVQPVEQKTEQPVQPEPVQETKVEEPQQTQPVVVPEPEVVQPVEQVPVAQQVEETPVVAQQTPVEQKTEKAQEGEQKPVEGERQSRGNNRNRGPRQNRGPREYRGPRENRGPREYRGPRGEGQEGERRTYNNQNRQRPNYRPKNQEQEQNDSDSDSSLEREQVARNFRKEEIRQLVDEGFQVVGKPKPKAKEGQKEYHERTHGRKAHHHHQQN